MGWPDNWVPSALATGGCAAACSTSAALSFTAFQGSTPQATLLCALQAADGQWALGFEAAGKGCVASVNESVTAAADYQCRCRAKDQIQGLALPIEGSCGSACQAGFEGRPGSVVGKGNTQACIPQSQVGNDNHFGGLGSRGVCESVEGDAPLASSSFSCVCLFGSQAAAASQAVGG